MAYRSIFQDAIDSIGGLLDDEELRQGIDAPGVLGTGASANGSFNSGERYGTQGDFRVGWKVVDHPDSNGGGRTDYGEPNQSLVVTAHLPDDYEPRDLMQESLYDLTYYTALGLPIGRSFKAARLGEEITLGRKLRMAPFGNLTGHKYGKYPHYRREGIGDGQGMKRHRPWEPKKPDTSWWDRF